MKGNMQVIGALNGLLKDELTAINQYSVHAGMCETWGYSALAKVVSGRAMIEMKHAERLIDRILFLEGMPEVGLLAPITIGIDVPGQINNDLAKEYAAVTSYNAAIRLCVDLADNTTRDMIAAHLTDEELHVDWLEAQMDQIASIGIQNYLAQQIYG